jgi:MFS transporter, DHA1 family, multidrug resistance protein
MYLYLMSLKNLPKGVKYYLLTQVVMGIGMGIWNLNLNYYLAYRGFDTAYIGRIIAVGPISTALFSIFSGYLCDRYGFKRNMVLGCLVKTIAMLAIYISIPKNIVYISRFLNGIGDSMIFTCSYPYITALVKKEQKSMVYSLLFSCMMFSQFLGNTAGGLLLNVWTKADRYGNSILVSAIFVGIVVFMRNLIPQTPVNTANIRRKFYIPKQKSILLYLLFDFIGFAGYFLSYSMLNLICRDSIGLPAWETGLVTGGLTVMSSIAVFVIPPITNVFGRVKLSMGILVSLTVLYGIMSGIHGYVFVILAIVTALLSNMIEGLLDAPMLNRIPEGEKGGYSGLRILITNIGTSMGTTIAGNLLAISNGLVIIYMIVAMLLFVQTIVFVFGFMGVVEDG